MPTTDCPTRSAYAARSGLKGAPGAVGAGTVFGLGDPDGHPIDTGASIPLPTSIVGRGLGAVDRAAVDTLITGVSTPRYIGRPMRYAYHSSGRKLGALCS